MTDTSPKPESSDVWGHDHEALPSRSGASWVLFAGIMIMLVGILNVIWGIAAISDSTFFVNDARFVFSGLNTWGWIMLLLGVAQMLAAYAIWRGGDIGRWFGITVAVFNAIGALLSIDAYPVWGLIVFGIDVLVIYALAQYGGDERMLA